MPELAAANNLTIQFDADEWRLYNGSPEETLPIVTAGADGLHYTPAFATARRLPNDHLPADSVMMVAVGWAAEDNNWHLGLLLGADLAAARGGKWCGLARWEDQDGDLAERAGRSLATLLERSFQLVPPPDQEPTIASPVVRSVGGTGNVGTATVGGIVRTAPPAEPAAPPVLMPLPIELEEWVMQEGPVGLVIQHTPGWYRGLLLRALFLSILVPVFGTLSIGALLSPFAPVNPAWLPFVGLVITIILLISAFFVVSGLLRGPITTFDRRARLLKQTTRSGRRTLVQSPYEGLEYVLVTHVINRRRARTPLQGVEEVATFWAEVWIHVFSPRRGFIEVCHVTDTEGRALAALSFTERRPLDLSEINSAVHHMAAHIGKEIGIRVEVEER